jgi:hypothetical protein
MVSQDELAIAIVLLVTWGSRRRLWFSTETATPNSGGDGMLATSGRSLVVVLDSPPADRAASGSGASRYAPRYAHFTPAR